jgi:vacuolar iron transporter family protein
MTASKKTSTNMGNYLGNAIYGALDGTVTTFAVMAGAIGAQLPSSFIIILGLANLFADGFSMSVGSFLSERSKLDYLKKIIAEKEVSISNGDSAIKEEIKEIYQEKGFRGKDLTKAVHIITSHRSTSLHEILNHEGIVPDKIRPITISLITFVSFILVGLMPLLPIMIMTKVSFGQTFVFVALVLFLVGSLRSRVTAVSWWRGGLEISLAGITASLIAYGIGRFLSGLI